MRIMIGLLVLAIAIFTTAVLVQAQHIPPPVVQQDGIPPWVHANLDDWRC